jgi:hypothetical protein
MTRWIAASALAALLGVAAWQAAEALQEENAAAPVSTEAKPETEQPVATDTDAVTDVSRPAAKAGSRPRAGLAGVTPMAQRVAVVGLLNKRNGLWRDLTMRPGEARRVGDVVVRVRACETTAPWETEKLTGAFVQLEVLGSDDRWRRVFSGWLYNESPSLNIVEHPIYDVWTKSCTMTHPEIGAETTSLSSGSGGASRSSAPKSAPAPSPAPAPEANAASSNAT